MKIGNIISKKKITVPEYFNTYDKLSDIDNHLPILLIGWDLVETNFPNHDITETKINNSVFWCSYKTENRDLYDESLLNFEKYSFKELIKDIKYFYIDPILSSNQRLIRIIRKLHGLKNIISYRHGNMIYIYSEKLIFGLDLDVLKYIGFKMDKILLKIKMLSEFFLLEDEIVIKYKKNSQKLDNGVKYIPYFFSLEHG